MTIKMCKSESKLHKLFNFDASLNIFEQLESSCTQKTIAGLIDQMRYKKLLFQKVTLNVAGNSTASSTRAFDFTYALCCKIFAEFLGVKELPIYLVEAHIAQLRDNYERIAYVR